MLDLFAFCGSIEIIVPDGAEIELEGTLVLGSIEQKLRKRESGEATRESVPTQQAGDISEPPDFRIEGRAICGSIEVFSR